MSFQNLHAGGRSVGSRRTAEPTTASVASAIFQINTAVSAFRRHVDAIGTTKDTPALRQKIHDTRQRIGQLVKETSAKLRALTDADHSPSANATKKVEEAKLAKDFQAVLQNYQKIQQLAVERESSYAPPLPASSFPISGDNSQSDLLAISDTDHEQLSLLREQKRQEVLWLGNDVAFNEAIIEERDQGIKDIQDEILQTNEIFKDLAVLVHDQGITIDDIDSNIEASHSATLQGTSQLVKASKSAKSGACCRWWVVIVCVVVLLVIVVLILFLTGNLGIKLTGSIKYLLI